MLLLLLLSLLQVTWAGARLLVWQAATWRDTLCSAVRRRDGHC
jgi:hypothetical protein